MPPRVRETQAGGLTRSKKTALVILLLGWSGGIGKGEESRGDLPDVGVVLDHNR